MSRKDDVTVVFDTENPEWTEADFARAKGADSLPTEVLTQFPRTLAKVRGAQKEPTKQPVSLRLSADVLEHFRSGGPGWQTRIDRALREAIARGLV